MNMTSQQREYADICNDYAPLDEYTRDEALAVTMPGIGYRFAKRTMDIVISLPALMILAPVMLVIWGYIRMHSDGPAIFKQTRIKKNRRQVRTTDSKAEPGAEKVITDRRKRDYYGEPFNFYKFATMYPDARQRFPELYAYDYSGSEIRSLHFKIKDDPRVPHWARWLRRSSLDELPNFYNVLKGDMSLIGPRPDIPEMTRYYTPEQRRIKLYVKPGVTGFAQIRGRGDLSFQQTLDYDLEYVKKAAIWLDIKIFVLTVLKLFQGRNGGAF